MTALEADNPEHLTDLDALIARALRADGIDVRVIADALGKRRRTVWDCLCGRTHRDIDPGLEASMRQAWAKDNSASKEGSLAIPPNMSVVTVVFRPEPGLAGDDYLRALTGRAVAAWRALPEEEREATRRRWAAR
jgi:hypothetical protein